MKNLILLFAIVLVLTVNSAQATEWLDFNSKTKKADSSGIKSKTSLLKTDAENEKKIIIQTIVPGCYKSKNILPDDNSYDSIISPGEAQLPVGHPDIPAFAQWILVPNGTEIELEIQAGTPIIYKDLKIQPVQPEPPESVDDYVPEFAVNDEIFNRNANYPGRFADFDSITKIRGQDSTLLWIYPYQYNPIEKVLSIYPDLKVTVHFEGKPIGLEKKFRTKSFDNFFKKIAPNAEQVLSITNVEEENQTDATFGGGDNPTGCDFLIITTPDFTNSARVLAEWKMKRGFITEVVSTEDIGTTTTEIRNYIKNAYDTYSPVPAYILLIGDSDFIPPWYLLNHSYHNFLTGADFYYADMNDPYDYTADMAIGRWPVETAAEADRFANRVIEYETTKFAGDFFYTNTTHCAEFQDRNTNSFADRRFSKTSEDMRNFLENKGYNPQRIYDASSYVTPSNWTSESYIIFENDNGGGQQIPNFLMKPGFAWDGDSSDIISAVNSGAFLLTHRDHGARTGWGSPSFWNSNVDSLNNGNRRPVVFTLNCQTAWFDNETDPSAANTSDSSECFSEHWFNHSSGGAIGLIGATRVSWSGRNDRLAWGWIDAIWTNFIEYNMGSYGSGEPVYRMGDVLNYGKSYLRTKYSLTANTKSSIEMFTWLGDPTLEIWTDIPGNINVSHTASLDVNSYPSYIDVNIDVDDALVCCVLNNEIIGKANSSGGSARVNFSNQLNGVGDLFVTVTKHNYIPYQGTATVFASGSFVAYKEHKNYENGDGNGLVEAGENTDVSIALNSCGNQTANNVYLTLTNVSQYLTVNSSSQRFYGNLDVGDVVTNDTLFSVSIAGDCPTSDQNLKAIIHADNGDWTNIFSIKIQVTGAASAFNWSTISSPQRNDDYFLAEIFAKDSNGRTAKTFTNKVNFSAWKPAPCNNPILISELDTQNYDGAEFVNVGNADVDISGWKIVIYDYNYPHMPELTFTIPASTVLLPGTVFTLKESGTLPGTFPNFFMGQSIYWTATSKAAVLLQNSSDEIKDFVCANGLNASDITSPTTIPSSHWTGDPVSSDYVSKRFGNIDNNKNSDWKGSGSGSASMGTLNSELTLPFDGIPEELAVSPETADFNNGNWAGNIAVTVLNNETNVYLKVDNGNGIEEKSVLFDIIVPEPFLIGNFYLLFIIYYLKNTKKL